MWNEIRGYEKSNSKHLNIVGAGVFKDLRHKIVKHLVVKYCW